MSAMSEKVLEAYYNHPKAMCDLYDLLVGDGNAKEIVEIALVRLTGEDTGPCQFGDTVKQLLNDVFAEVPHEDAYWILAGTRIACLCGTKFMAEELPYWRERCANEN